MVDQTERIELFVAREQWRLMDSMPLGIVSKPPKNYHLTLNQINTLFQRYFQRKYNKLPSVEVVSIEKWSNAWWFRLTRFDTSKGANV